jgi:hypothetical protein
MTEEVAAADLLADGPLQLGVSRGPPNRAGNEVREKAALFRAAIAGAGVVRADIGGRGLLNHERYRMTPWSSRHGMRVRVLGYTGTRRHDSPPPHDVANHRT